MDVNLAWQRFVQTGNVVDYLTYVSFRRDAYCDTGRDGAYADKTGRGSSDATRAFTGG